jgi:hypothetical protein
LGCYSPTDGHRRYRNNPLSTIWPVLVLQPLSPRVQFNLAERGGCYSPRVQLDPCGSNLSHWWNYRYGWTTTSLLAGVPAYRCSTVPDRTHVSEGPKHPASVNDPISGLTPGRFATTQGPRSKSVAELKRLKRPTLPVVLGCDVHKGLTMESPPPALGRWFARLHRLTQAGLAAVELKTPCNRRSMILWLIIREVKTFYLLWRSIHCVYSFT